MLAPIARPSQSVSGNANLVVISSWFRRAGAPPAPYDPGVIARIWRGAVRAADAEAYVAYIEETGLREYRQTPGNRGAWLLRRMVGDRCEIVTLSHWDSLDSIRAFAGDEVERAVYYPEDEQFLIEHDDVVTHWEIFE